MTRLIIVNIVLVVFSFQLPSVNGFSVTTPTTKGTTARRNHHLLSLGSVKSSSSSKTRTSANAETITLLEDGIDQAISDLLKSSSGQKKEKEDKENHLISLIEQMEALNDCNAAHNRSPLFFGEWHTWWTNCPPPSDGQLGPFRGTSQQVIAPPTSSSSDSSAADASSLQSLPLYQNLLKVAPNDWLMAVLDGVYQDWNGIPLKKKNNNKDDDNKDYKDRSISQAAATTTTTAVDNTTMDWGANHWKVTFIKLTIYLFGFPLFSKDFDADTSRVWRTTYMDSNNNNDNNNNIRIVRASQTGLAQDEVIFYTKRQPSPFV